MLHDELVPSFTVASVMGREYSSRPPEMLMCSVGQEETGDLQLTAEDYLQGVIGMVNELVRPVSCCPTLCISLVAEKGARFWTEDTADATKPRLSINSVTAQNFSLPVKIAAFVNDIFASYSLVRIPAQQSFSTTHPASSPLPVSAARTDPAVEPPERRPKAQVRLAQV
jgi:hypothetical protein